MSLSSVCISPRSISLGSLLPVKEKVSITVWESTGNPISSIAMFLSYPGTSISNTFKLKATNVNTICYTVAFRLIVLLTKYLSVVMIALYFPKELLLLPSNSSLSPLLFKDVSR